MVKPTLENMSLKEPLKWTFDYNHMKKRHLEKMAFEIHKSRKLKGSAGSELYLNNNIFDIYMFWFKRVQSLHFNVT